MTVAILCDSFHVPCLNLIRLEFLRLTFLNSCNIQLSLYLKIICFQLICFQFLVKVQWKVTSIFWTSSKYSNIFSKGTLEKLSHFCYSSADVSSFPSQSFLHNHVAVTSSLFKFCSWNKEWFFFREISRSVSIFLKFSRHCFHVNTYDFFMSPFLSKSVWSCWSKYFWR